MRELDWTKKCDRCGETVERYRGMADVTCHGCGAEYNAGGQRLRDDWRGNPSTWDEDISDLDGYEMQHAGDDFDYREADDNPTGYIVSVEWDKN